MYKKEYARCVVFCAIFAPVLAIAHDGSGVQGGFISGFTHPLLGLDHVTAMVAVGIWGAFMGRPAIWVLPVLFPLVMSIGGVLGIAGAPIPFIGLGIALSCIGIGLAIAIAWRAPLAIAAAMIGVFAIFHGYAHGQNLPGAANPLAYAVGFVLGSGLLHLTGIVFGLLDEVLPAGRLILKIAGAVIALIGFGFLFGLL